MIVIFFLIIYILGIVVTLWAIYYNLESGDEVTLFELLLSIAVSLCSWITLLIIVLVMYGDKTIFKKK